MTNITGLLLAAGKSALFGSNKLLHLLDNGKIIVIAPQYKEQRGHPVLFSKHFFSELTRLNSELGAREVIKNNREYLILVDVDDTGIIRDVDSKDDLDK